MNRLLLLLCCIALQAACATTRTASMGEDFGEAEWERSAVPIRPGVPGERPF